MKKLLNIITIGLISNNFISSTTINNNSFIIKNNKTSDYNIKINRYLWKDTLYPKKAPTTKNFNNTFWIDYGALGYSNLNDFLNSGKTFSIPNLSFESSIGTLSKYKEYFNDFGYTQKVEVLKKYINTKQRITYVSWWNTNFEESSAAIYLSFSDYPGLRYLFGECESVLQNSNTIDVVKNILWA